MREDGEKPEQDNPVLHPLSCLLVLPPPLRPAVLSALAALALYAVTLGGTYVYDDLYVVQDDPRLTDVARWGEYWTKDYFNGGADNLYRPLVSMTYALQAKLHGSSERAAWGFHLVNWLLHAAVSAAVAELARRMTRGNVTLALLAGLLFAAHPIHVEAVAGIVGRAELMCGLGMIVALALFLRPLTTRRAWAIWGCFVVAMLSKEQAMLLPLLLIAAIPLRRRLMQEPVRADASHVAAANPSAGVAAAAHPLDYAPPDVRARRAAGPGTLLVVLLLWSLALYVYVRERILKFWWDRSFLDWAINPLVLSSGADRWLMPFALLGRYVALLVAPVKLSLDYGGSTLIGSTARIDDPYLYLGIASAFAWVALFVIACLRRARAVALCLFAVAALWGLVSNLPALIGVNFAERLMYIPSAFACILGSVLLARLPRRVLVPLAACVLVLFSLRTVTYAWRWNDRQRLFEHAVRDWPQSGRLHLLLGEELHRRGRTADATAVMARARALEPAYDTVWRTSAAVALAAGDYDFALHAARRALEIKYSLATLKLIGEIADRMATTRAATSGPAAGPSAATAPARQPPP